MALLAGIGRRVTSKAAPRDPRGALRAFAQQMSSSPNAGARRVGSMFAAAAAAPESRWPPEVREAAALMAANPDVPATVVLLSGQRGIDQFRATQRGIKPVVRGGARTSAAVAPAPPTREQLAGREWDRDETLQATWPKRERYVAWRVKDMADQEAHRRHVDNNPPTRRGTYYGKGGQK